MLPVRTVVEKRARAHCLVGPSFLPAPPTGWSDTITGADGPRFWDRMISTEGARSRRYGRPVTVCFAEFVGLDRLSRQWGADVGERALILAARTLGKESRASDHIARLGRSASGSS
jgi:GGDEF domain-containing protein